MARGRGETDARGRLEADPFDYRETKAGELMISRGGRMVVTLGGSRAAAILKALDKTDEAGAQLVLAKATGNYKRGNDR
jgi:hypothetical protein